MSARSKKNIFAFLVFFLIAGCHRDGGDLQQKKTLSRVLDLQNARELSRTKKLPLLMEFSTEWCPYCRFIDEKVYTDPYVAERLVKFVLSKVDGDKAESQHLMDKYNVKGFPTFIIFSPSGGELLRFSDVSSTGEMAGLLDKALLKAGGGTAAAAEAEAELLKMAEASKKDADKAVGYLKRLIRGYPDSPRIPEYYKRLAELYTSDAVRRPLLKKAASIIQERLERIEGLDEKTKRITLDEHIDLLAGLYKGLGEYGLVERVYLNGARIVGRVIDEGGGIKDNLHLIGTVTHYFIEAGDLKGGIKFLKRALTEAPDYWPVYSNLSKVLARRGEYEEAAFYAKRGYLLAGEVARPKLALIQAEIYALQGRFSDALRVLEDAKGDLLRTGSAGKGRAKKIISQLKEREAEYRRAYQE